MLKFWEISDAGKLEISITKVYTVLNELGFRKEVNGSETIFYKITDQFIDRVTVKDLTDAIKNYIKEFRGKEEKLIEFASKPPRLLTFGQEKILEAVTKFSYKRILEPFNWTYLKDLDIRIQRHASDKAFFYFENGFVAVTKNGATLHGYLEMPDNEKVFKPMVVPKRITLVDIGNENQQAFARKGADFYHFLNMISGKIPESDSVEELEPNPDKLKYLMQIIGSYLHDFREKGKTDWAPLICDENVGGSGKGTLVQAAGCLIDYYNIDPRPGQKPSGTICEIDGRKPQEKYDPLELSPQTRLKVYNDVSQAFLTNTDSIYNEITEFATIRPMWGGLIRIPYKFAWKVLLLANFTLRGGDGHLLRRFKIYYMSPFFNRNRKIRDYYGHTFFGPEWEEKDWNYFYSVLFWCVKLWLKSDYSIDYDDPEFLEFKIEATYFPEFREYVDALTPGYHTTSELFRNFKADARWKYEKHIEKITNTTFGRFLVNYLSETKREYHKTSNRTQIYIGKLPEVGAKQTAISAKQAFIPGF